jgi:hypothetical protein
MSDTDADFAAAVWAAPLRTLANGTPVTPTTAAQVFAAAVWAYSSRTMPPTDLLSAIKLKITGSAISAVPYLSAPTRRGDVDYIVVEDAGASLGLVTSSLQIRETRIRFRVYGPGAAVAGGLGDQVEALFTDCTLGFVGGWSGRWFVGDRRHVKDLQLSAPGNEVWYLALEFHSKVKR